MNSNELDSLRKVYSNAQKFLLDKILNTSGVGTKTYYNTILQSLYKVINQLDSETLKFILDEIPQEYRQALEEVYSYFTSNHLLMKAPEMFAQLHNDAIYTLVREMQYHVGEGLGQVGRQVKRYLASSRDEALRMAGLEASAEKAATGSTIVDMKKNMVKKMQEQGFMTVQYGSGKNARQVSLEDYAMLCARSTTREAGNLARENQLTANGYDLMIMTEHSPTCEVCATLQGRVYSISGNDKRFPPLSRAFPNGYRNVHPNCRHSIHPFIEEFNDVNAAIEKSNRPFTDPRTQEEKNLYNKQQAEARKAREDRSQFERYRERLGDDAPKTYSAFKRAKNANGEKWKNLQSSYRKAKPTQSISFTQVRQVSGKDANLSPLVEIPNVQVGGASNLKNNLTNGENDDIITLTSGALNPYSKRAEKHAEQYYESVRKMSNDVDSISKNVGWKPEAIEKIKKYIFIDEHDLYVGVQRFDPSYDMAQSWQRLIEGKNKIQDKDLVLLKHEYYELTLVKKGYSQDEAHRKASAKHNYSNFEKGQ